MRLAAEYVLPLRWDDDEALHELTEYLRVLAGWIDVTVVDGSDADLFAAHAHSWAAHVRHIQPNITRGANGKVRGVLTGLALARHERVVLADDDVRYDRSSLDVVVSALEGAELVAPQNVFRPLPWHARWDTGRILVNRAFHRDYPGTYAVRRSVLDRTGGYDADALFENLELERTVRVTGGRLRLRPDVYVARRPPTLRHFLGQRVRQAYDSHAQPLRLVLELSIAPLVFGLRRRPDLLALLTLGVVAAAEFGRRRAGGHREFPRSAPLWAPLWALERAVTSWIALGARARGGVRYADTRFPHAATSLRELRRRHCAPGRGVRGATAASRAPDTQSSPAGQRSSGARSP
ncbi:glycosyltransferase [Microbacterium testaceum]|uniref:glycosyltransferase n=1 Tax=Microbacterium testaceum TaxID=2033 RepID=UPI001D179C9E|nr:glycosyltransferase family 2 protein [Microbacterium testaceum]MCC4250307.1 glycosyltransferase family 2 protein [Microbacterium testaceum]